MEKILEKGGMGLYMFGEMVELDWIGSEYWVGLMWWGLEK